MKINDFTDVAKTNPIKANTKPNKANKMPKQTQSNPILSAIALAKADSKGPPAARFHSTVLLLKCSTFCLRTSTFVENPLQITPFYAKQSQFAKYPNEHKLSYNNEL